MSEDINVNYISEQLNNKVDLANGANQGNVDYVVESKFPTSADPTWYRVYKSGWVEQGGSWTHSTGTMYLTLPIEMSSTTFSVVGSYGNGYGAGNNNNFVLKPYSTTQICLIDNNAGSMIWEAKGMKASS